MGTIVRKRRWLIIEYTPLMLYFEYIIRQSAASCWMSRGFTSHKSTGSCSIPHCNNFSIVSGSLRSLSTRLRTHHQRIFHHCQPRLGWHRPLRTEATLCTYVRLLLRLERWYHKMIIWREFEFYLGRSIISCFKFTLYLANRNLTVSHVLCSEFRIT